MTPCHHYQMRRKLPWIGDICTEKRKCQEYVKLNWGVKMEQTNNYIKSFARMESAWVFNVGLLFLIISISKIKHWSFSRHFLRTLKFVLRFIRFKLCFSKKCSPITDACVPLHADGGGSTCNRHNLHRTVKSHLNCINLFSYNFWTKTKGLCTVRELPT